MASSFTEETQQCLSKLDMMAQCEVIKALKDQDAKEIFLQSRDTYVWIIHGNVYRYYVHKRTPGDVKYTLVVFQGDMWDDIGGYATLDEARGVRDEWQQVLYARECLRGFTEDLESEVQFKIIDAEIEDWQDVIDDLPEEFTGKRMKK